MIKATNRLPKFKNCKHEHRLLKYHRGYFCFYCTKCLIFTIKKEDTELNDFIDEINEKYK